MKNGGKIELNGKCGKFGDFFTFCFSVSGAHMAHTRSRCTHLRFCEKEKRGHKIGKKENMDLTFHWIYFVIIA